MTVAESNKCYMISDSGTSTKYLYYMYTIPKTHFINCVMVSWESYLFKAKTLFKRD